MDQRSWFHAELDRLHVALLDAVVRWGEDGLVREAIRRALIGRYCERIGDHAVDVGQRVRDLVEGELPAYGGLV